MTMESLELRLHSLERRNARLKSVVLLAVVLALGANFTNVSENLWAGPPHPAVQDTVRANRIEVVDKDGKLLAVLGKLTDRFNQTSTGLALVSNDKQVVRLTLDSNRDGSLNHGTLTVSNPKDAEQKQLFSAGVSAYTEGVGLVPELQLEQRESKSSTTVGPAGLTVFVNDGERTSAAAISLQANEDHSAKLELGGLFKPFKVRAIAEPDKPRLEVEKDKKITTYGFVP